ncbi:phage tail assembly chaperone [Fulvimarina sp. MAC3]
MKLSSDAFWAMTPCELAAAFSAHAPARQMFAPSKGELESLMRRFPDTN